MSLILSLANASIDPDSSIARPSLPSLTLVTLALTSRCFNAPSRRASVVVPAITPMFLPLKSVNFCRRGALDQEAAAVEEDERREIDVLHPRLRRRRVGAIDVGLAGRDHGDALGGRADGPSSP
jgi:hypothetical protein